MRRVGRAMVWAMVGWSGAVALQAAPLAPVRPKPKLIVALSIDQFAGDLYKRYRPTYTGGLKRLSAGITFTGYQSHGATETCPGHSTILTGRHPSGTGIVSNDWLDRKTGKPVYCVSVPGAETDARGAQNLKVSTYGDWLKEASPANRVYAVSGKDRAAIMMGGHQADAIYWWKDGTGFSTSRYAGPATPEVLAPADAFNKALFAKWQASAPDLWPAQSAACTRLATPLATGKIQLTGKVPPETSVGTATGDFVHAGAFQAALRASPTYDAITLDFAKQLIDLHRLGHGRGVDLLAVSLSATDYVGHRFGGGGPEMCGQMAALDRALGAFFAKLDGLHVPYMIVLTADHGGSDPAERLAAKGVKAERVDPKVFVKRLNAVLEANPAFGHDPIVGDDPQQLSVSVGVDPVHRADVREAAIAWLKAQPEVANVYTAQQIAAAVPARGKPVTALTFLERLNESYDAERSGDIAVVFAEHTTLYMPVKPTDYTSGHGSVWDYDRRVPMLFWWPGVKASARAEPVETVDIAPTLAAITATKRPEVDGRCLAVVAGVCR